MNALTRTRAAEGYDRAAFTIADTEAMVAIGVLPDDDSFELWDGEIVPKMTKNDPHEIWKARLARWLYRNLPDSVNAAVEPTLRLAPKTFVEPDLLMHPAGLRPSAVRGPDVLLAIEIASSSLSRDLEAKARLYARFGVEHYWVLDAEASTMLVHRREGASTYRPPTPYTSDQTLTLPFEPALSFRLADLG